MMAALSRPVRSVSLASLSLISAMPPASPSWLPDADVSHARSKASTTAVLALSWEWARLIATTLSRFSALSLTSFRFAASKLSPEKCCSTSINWSSNSSVACTKEPSPASPLALSTTSCCTKVCSSLLYANPAMSSFSFSRGVRVGGGVEAHTSNSWPAKGRIFFTMPGSFSVKLAKRSPAEMMEPLDKACLIEPDSVAFRGMIIFIASTSQ
mmetsp:Transcript_31986/g.65129  ORF Transcript_31986/g.65129 Transcript_31986/m.65129 type:complete len:212 (+) Transcript_31986:3602-4237(+)